ncbi:hypothetical protein GOBAR_DD18569 [Gossypium barbadense]|nr:hypothetical protein GOBAR_DD18569 [Gossypium barbadense]
MGSFVSVLKGRRREFQKGMRTWEATSVISGAVLLCHVRTCPKIGQMCVLPEESNAQLTHSAPSLPLNSLTQKDMNNQITNVYIWDMDETLILLKSLLNGSYAEAFAGLKDAQKGVEIGKMWEKHILQISDDFFFYEQIENCNKPFLEALSKYDDGQDLSDYDFNQDGFSPPHDDLNKRKLAYRHRLIANKYKQLLPHMLMKSRFSNRDLVLESTSLHDIGNLIFIFQFKASSFVFPHIYLCLPTGLHNILDPEMMDLWDALYKMTDEYTDGWLSSARALLEQCLAGNEDPTICNTVAGGVVRSNATGSRHINVLVTSGSLIPSLVKCLLFRLDNLISHENVYSSWDVGKLQCFQWIKERFDNRNTRFCAIGDGWEECEAAQTMNWPFIKVDLRPNSSHRFPGLTLRTVGFYFSIVYGNPDSENDDD